jgi:hypothetical protein
MAAFPNRGNRKVGRARDDSHVVFGQKFPGERGSVKGYVDVMQQPILLSPKLGPKFRTFSRSRHKPSQQYAELTLACQDEFFANNPLDIRENYEHALDLAFHVSRSSLSR